MPTRIIVVEDDPNQVTLLEIMFKRIPDCEGYIFTTFEELTTSSIIQELHTVDSIMLDHKNELSPIQGDSMFQQLRELGYSGPIGGISSMVQTYVDYLISKPFTPQMIYEAVEIIRSNNGGSRELLAERFPVQKPYGTEINYR